MSQISDRTPHVEVKLLDPEKADELVLRDYPLEPGRTPWPGDTIPQHIKDISELFTKAGYDIYLVGGSVRDMMMRRQPNDYDFVCSASPEEILALLRENGIRCDDRYLFLQYVPAFVGENGEEKVDISSYKGGSLRTDLLLRDITINALACSIKTGEVLDFTGGVQDIRDGVIRLVKKITDDNPGVIFRVIRFSLEFGFRIDPGTYQLLLDSLSVLEHARTSTLIHGMTKLLTGGREILVEGHYPNRRDEA